MDFSAIQHQLKNLYSKILIDKIIDSQNEKQLICLKNVTFNEPFFENSGEAAPCLPESALIEILKQASTVLILKQYHLSATRLFFEHIENLSFQKQIFPGDQLRIETEIIKISDTDAKIQAKALVDGKIICQGKINFQITQLPSKPQIHPTASVHPSAILEKDVVVGPYSIVNEDVIIGKGTILSAHTAIEKWTRIGQECRIHFGCVIGSFPQDKKYKGEKAGVIIGDRNILREYVTVNRATGENNNTVLGNDNLILTNVHIGHNCKLGNNIVITNMSQISGHVEIENNAIIGGLVGIHQNARVGAGAMIGGYSRVAQDIPPYMLIEGAPATIRALNLVGLKRSGVSSQSIAEIKTIFRIYFRSNLNTAQALEKLAEETITSPEALHLLNFLKAPSKRGITKRTASEDETEN